MSKFRNIHIYCNHASTLDFNFIARKLQKYSIWELDIKMPKMNGFSFYREIKKLNKDLRICSLTAGEMYYGVFTDIFSRLPANYFICKPISNEEIVNHINEIIDDDKSVIIEDN